MYTEGKVSYFFDRYGIFHRILKQRETPHRQVTAVYNPIQEQPLANSTWLRLILMFWNVKVLKAAFRFGVAALIMNQYEKLGFAALLLCFAL